VPINAKLHPKELIWILEHSEARVLFCEPEVVATLQQEWQSQPDPSLMGAQQLQSITGAGPLHPREALQSAFRAQKNRRQ